jgi:very-long-chain (3R)-3-hydroxyacyl-CoA dehydratase
VSDSVCARERGFEGGGKKKREISRPEKKNPAPRQKTNKNQTAVQVASRLWCLWGIVNLVPSLTTTSSFTLLRLPFLDSIYPGATFSISLVSLLSAWAVSEIIRYGFFALKEALGNDGVPYFATWLRYSGFILLYPLGVSSELAMAWFALPVIASKGLWSVRMPNSANWAFDYWWACVLTMLSYAPGLPHLYGYMLTQRKKVLGGDGGGGAAKAAAASGGARASGGGRKKRA